MTQKNDVDCLGFLTVRYADAVGYFGGLLTVNPVGRPLEFHCSLPIKPSRAQTILYGESLCDFLVGEQIALAIATKVKQPPAAIFTDLPAALTLRNVYATPIACVSSESAESYDCDSSANRHNQLQKPVGFPKKESRFQLAHTDMVVLEDYAKDAETITALWQRLNPQINPREPFARVVDALMEANPVTKAA